MHVIQAQLIRCAYVPQADLAALLSALLWPTAVIIALLVFAAQLAATILRYAAQQVQAIIQVADLIRLHLCQNQHISEAVCEFRRITVVTLAAHLCQVFLHSQAVVAAVLTRMTDLANVA